MNILETAHLHRGFILISLSPVPTIVNIYDHITNMIHEYNIFRLKTTQIYIGGYSMLRRFENELQTILSLFCENYNFFLKTKFPQFFPAKQICRNFHSPMNSDEISDPLRFFKMILLVSRHLF